MVWSVVQELAYNYMTTRFPIDLLALFPFELSALGAGGYNSTLFKGLRLFRFLRIGRVVQLHAIPGQEKMTQAKRVRATLGWFLFITHWIACIWWGIGVTEYRQAVDEKSENMSKHTWLQRPNYKSVLLDDNTVRIHVTRHVARHA